MVSVNQQENSHSAKYVELLLELHSLMRAGKSDGDEADAVRDAMDEPWRHLSPEQIKRMRGLSADLHSMGKDRLSPPDGPTEDQTEEFKTAIARENWDQALVLVRNCEATLAPAQAALARGSCWVHLELHAAAILFFEESLPIEEENPDCKASLLMVMMRAGQFDRAEPLAKEIIRRDSNALLLLLASEVFFLRVTEVSPAESVEITRCAVETAQKGLRLAEQAPEDEVLRSHRVLVNLYLAVHFDLHDSPAEARAACDEALNLTPADDNALMFLGWLTSEQCPEEEKPDFRRDFQRNLAASAVMESHSLSMIAAGT